MCWCECIYLMILSFNIDDIILFFTDNSNGYNGTENQEFNALSAEVRSNVLDMINQVQALESGMSLIVLYWPSYLVF